MDKIFWQDPGFTKAAFLLILLIARRGARAAECSTLLMLVRRMPDVDLIVPMFYVYILLSLKDNNLYVGSTNDLKIRKRDHNLDKVESTKNRRPLKLICYECYLTETEALRREKYLKSSDGKKDLYKRLPITLSKYS